MCVSLLTSACNMQVHTSTGQSPIAFVSPRKLTRLGVERLPKVRHRTEAPDWEDDLVGTAITVADQYVQDVKELELLTSLRPRLHLMETGPAPGQKLPRQILHWLLPRRRGVNMCLNCLLPISGVRTGSSCSLSACLGIPSRKTVGRGRPPRLGMRCASIAKGNR